MLLVLNQLSVVVRVVRQLFPKNHPSWPREVLGKKNRSSREVQLCAPAWELQHAASEGQDTARRGGAGTSTVGAGTRPLRRQILVPAAAGKSKYRGAEKWFWVPSKKSKIFIKKKLSGWNEILAKRPPGI